MQIGWEEGRRMTIRREWGSGPDEMTKAMEIGIELGREIEDDGQPRYWEMRPPYGESLIIICDVKLI